MPRTRKIRLGWLGPLVVLVGVLAASVGTWFMVVSRPEAGEVIERVALDGSRVLLVRDEVGGDRNFVELRDGDRVVWQAFVPTYAGRPGATGLAWSDLAVSVRVIRDDKAEVFAIAMTNGSKLGGIKLSSQPATRQTAGPVTLTDHVYTYEIVAGRGWNQMISIDLGTGEPRWKQDLGAAPVDAGGIEGGVVWVRQGAGTRKFRAVDGVESSSASSS
ncbi:MAG TPA: hypothetical protein VK427_08215 [Kofleriaceae bacterium]|nr:hypothetical protein [Kofleriaceae bacterium]